MKSLPRVFGAALLAGALAMSSAREVRANPCAGALAPARYEAAALTIRYFGVSTLMISDGTERLLVDGFFSRPGSIRSVFGKIGSQPDAVAEGLGLSQPPVVGLLIAHAHHDHALDAPAITIAQTRTIVLGTPSVAALAKAQGAPAERVCEAREGEPVRLGAFTVTPFYTPHSSSPLLLRWLLDHRLHRPPSGPAWFGRFKDDQNLSFLIEHGERTVLVHPSAGRSNLGQRNADIVFLGIGRLGLLKDDKVRPYLEGAVGEMTPTVAPVHWDSMTTPLLQPLKPTPWPFDNIGKGLSALCRFATPRGKSVVRLEAGASLVLTPQGAVLTGMGSSYPCAPTRPPH